MITYDEAYNKVMSQTLEFGTESVALLQGIGRILADEVRADRDFPPFDRATKDGIAIQYATIEKGIESFKIEGVISAGMPQRKLSDTHNCMEIMTGAVVPENADTVIMYEHLNIKDGYATLNTSVVKGQDIHYKGSDVISGSVLLKKNKLIGAAEIGVLAAVGKSGFLVKKLPKVCVISTGNELVEVSEQPLPHQIRKSNVLSLYAALQKENIEPKLIHLRDDRESIKKELIHILKTYDVVLLSGGVSRGKFDFIPEVMETLEVKKVFHRVAQRPGKPFWFGAQESYKTVVFSFPGNPVSTYANYHIYFLPWLRKSLGHGSIEKHVLIEKAISNTTSLTRFVQVKTQNKKGVIWAMEVRENGSGDLTSLANSDGFICLRPREKAYKKGESVPFISTNPQA
ncbi:MAG: molybdopterin molybdotransferase MoeA [Maribacter sp.]|nr:molybdopterin molybdotransferase MoeA [Maribacter sp.]